MIVCIYIIVAEFATPNIYNYWAVLSCDAFLIVFWIASFALMASQVAPYMSSYSDCAYGYCYTYSLTGTARVLADCMAAVAGLGGLELYDPPSSPFLSQPSIRNPY
jgi:hypothetical protein